LKDTKMTLHQTKKSLAELSEMNQPQLKIENKRY
jgi:hypothetical protein